MGSSLESDITTNDVDFLRTSKGMQRDFWARGYPRELVQGIP